MDLVNAKQLANILVDELRPYCDLVEIAGSIRRGKPQVKDIDIVAIPNDIKMITAGLFDTRGLVDSLADPLSRANRTNGLKRASFTHKGAPIDIYWATPETWSTLLLIRTGSKEHNIKLCNIAKSKGMHLHASGDGLFSNGTRIAGDTEESIFEALGIPYLEPQSRC